MSELDTRPGAPGGILQDDVSTLDAFDAIAYGFTRKRGFE